MTLTSSTKPDFNARRRAKIEELKATGVFDELKRQREKEYREALQKELERDNRE